MLYAIIILVFLLCFFIYQWWFQNSRFRNMPDLERAKIKPYNRPIAWAIYSVIVFILLVTLIGYQIFILMGYIMELDI